MADLFPPSRDEKRACIERELKYRARVYPRRIADGKMSQELADNQIRVMTAILGDYSDAK